jgi:hypothetical protein
MSGRVAAVEALYEAVVTEPGRWSAQTFLDWTDTIALDGTPSRTEAKFIRRALRMAQRLQEFWMDAPERQDIGWESRVDLALGPRAWRPVLDLAESELDASRSSEAFTDVARLFPLVNGEEFLDGMDFAAWSLTQS